MLSISARPHRSTAFRDRRRQVFAIVDAHSVEGPVLQVAGFTADINAKLVKDIEAIWRAEEFTLPASVYYNHFDRAHTPPWAKYTTSNTCPRVLDNKLDFARLMAGSAFHPASVPATKEATATFAYPALLKPAGGDSGVGIHIVNSADKAKAIVEASLRPMVLQQYVDNPMLWRGCKIDFRLFVLFLPQQQRAFLHEWGIARVSSQKYSKKITSGDVLPHLTNSFVHFGIAREHDDSNLTLKDFLAAQTAAVRKACESSLRNAVKDMAERYFKHMHATTLAKRSAAAAAEPYIILGIDVMFDDTHRAKVFECNHKFAAWYSDTAFPQRPHMFADFFRIVAGGTTPTVVTEISVQKIATASSVVVSKSAYKGRRKGIIRIPKTKLPRNRIVRASSNSKAQTKVTGVKKPAVSVVDVGSSPSVDTAAAAIAGRKRGRAARTTTTARLHTRPPSSTPPKGVKRARTRKS